MSIFKEIVTKAVTAKAKKCFCDTHEVFPEQVPNTILGCWIINHTFSGTEANNVATINGSFDVNVWYSFDGDTQTAVTCQTIGYNKTIRLNPRCCHACITTNNEIIVRSLRQPTVSDVEIVDGTVRLAIEHEIGVELIGDTIVKVCVEECCDDYEEVCDDIDDDEIDDCVSAIDEINPDFL